MLQEILNSRAVTTDPNLFIFGVYENRLTCLQFKQKHSSSTSLRDHCCVFVSDVLIFSFSGVFKDSGTFGVSVGSAT